MRRLLFSLILSLTAFASIAQQRVPAIKQGSVVGYTLKLHGQQVALALTVTRLSDSVVLDWKMRNTASGAYIMLPNAVSKANKLSFVQPGPDTKITLPPDRTFFLISRKAYQNLMQKHSFEYDNTVYDLKNDGKPEMLMVEGKKLEVWHVAAKDETTQYWILNDVNFPLICRIMGNPLEVDAEMISIK